jgi:glucose-specific phosphotransferase system IIA component
VNLMGNLQQFGRALMLPMIALPAAAIFLRLSTVPWEQFNLPGLSEAFYLAGNTVFTYLPYLFAVGVAMGLTENAGSAGLSALIGYFLFMQIHEQYLGVTYALGVPGGIMIGLLAALSYHRFKDIQLPEYIQFFGGPRFVPLFMSFAVIIYSFAVVKLYPYVEASLISSGTFVIELGGFGAFIYGMLHRLLVPLGLHYILNNFAWFHAGSYTTQDGHIVYGDLPRFFAGDPAAGIYMAGLYPIMMFALPAIAFAIIHEAREDLKPKVKATFLTAALASFLTGVTEPIEFAFLFVAPYLFFVHSILSGMAMWITYELDIHHGFSFSAGAIDFLINIYLARNEWLLIPIGLIYGLVYYGLFRWAIRRFQIPTPGREDGPLDELSGDIPHRAPLILEALGGKENIKKLEACITRLRLTLVNERLMDAGALKHLGAAGIIRLGGGNVQVVFGTFSELIREEMMKILRKNIRQVLFSSPVQGKMIPLEEVPDQIFAAQLVGNGVAFLPERGELVSPVEGEIIHLHPNKHAVGIRTAEGLEVLLHIGIDTVNIKESCFQSFIREGQKVKAGELLIRFNMNRIKKNGKSTATPMVVTNSDLVKSWSFAPFKSVRKGQASVMSVTLKEINTASGGKSDV